MNTNETVRLTRNVEAFIVPSGEQVVLKKDEPVRITQALGGTYTVVFQGNMYQISGANADALGYEPELIDAGLVSGTNGVDEHMIWDQLKSVYDPEIPVNIVDLGLIYDLKLKPAPRNKGTNIYIKMTLTAPGCGMGPVIAGNAEQKVKAVPGVHDVLVELVWEPQWNKDMMTEEALLQLGLL
ncbi:MAG: putative Fe-S cluster assembly protein SufT [Fidelibacterota bacterium]